MPKGICEFEACTGAKLAKGLCKPHYYQQWRGKTLKRTRDQVTPQERFWEKVHKTPGCWYWESVTDSAGYGSFKLNGRMLGAHRVSWTWANGPISEGLEVDHMCWTPSCVNPSHLRVVTRSANSQNVSGSRIDSSTGVRCVEWRRDYKKYRAYARQNGKRINLGHFETLDEAEAVAIEWRKRNMPYSIADAGIDTGGTVPQIGGQS